MIVTVRYFAWVRTTIGIADEKIELASDILTAGCLAHYLCSLSDKYAEVLSDLSVIRVAVDQEHADWTTPLTNECEVALFPPVTGG